MWFFYALVGALFASVRRTSEKQLSHKLNHFTIGWAVQLSALPVLLLALLAKGTVFNPLALGMDFWLPTILVWVGFYPLNVYLYINALKHGELSKILPLSSLGPIFSLLLGWLLLNERPTLLAVFSIAVTVVGIYVLNLKGRYLHNPLKIFTADKANLYTLLGLLMVVAASILDKKAINASEPLYYSFVSTLGAVVALYVSAKLHGVKERSETRKHARPLMVAGTLFGLAYGTHMLALATGPLAYVSAVRSSGALMIGSLMGIFFLKETVTKPKVIALVLIVAGSLMLGLS
jgi:uncharacterized membrane protein